MSFLDTASTLDDAVAIMDTLDNTEWDVVISGTGLSQSLLALSLSRSGNKILHLDRNDYYGGDEAALSLHEAAEWAYKHRGAAPEEACSSFSRAQVSQQAKAEDDPKKLGFSRAYSLALTPKILYARSNILPALVSSRIHNQLEFQAVGAWFTVSKDGDSANMTRVPSGREDIFRDDSLDLRAKRSLMKFLRFVGSHDEESEQERWHEIKQQPVGAALKDHFGLKSDTAVAPLLALALTPGSETETTVEQAVPRIARHLRSIGMFGAGFSAVMPRWGGLAEIAQVACRACAVGGGVYVLGKGIADGARGEDGALKLELSDGEKISAKTLVGCPDDLPAQLRTASNPVETETVTRSISIVSSPLQALFPPTSEGGITPAAAVVVANTGAPDSTPARLIVRSGESGECPDGQCILYAALPGVDKFDLLREAVQAFLNSTKEAAPPEVLWSLTYTQRVRILPSNATHGNKDVMELGPLPSDLVLDDIVLDNIKRSWQKVTGDDEGTFMKFEAREGSGEDEEAI